MGGTCHFGHGIQICMPSICLLTFVVLHLLGMRGCSLGKIDLAICISICKVGLLYSTPRYPGRLSECYFYFGCMEVLLLYVEVLLPEVEVALGEPAGDREGDFNSLGN